MNNGYDGIFYKSKGFFGWVAIITSTNFFVNNGRWEHGTETWGWKSGHGEGGGLDVLMIRETRARIRTRDQQQSSH